MKTAEPRRCRRWMGCALVVTSALTLHSVPAHAVGVDPASATPVQREQAQSRFERGRMLLEEGKAEEAITEFRASLEIVGSPNTRLMVARSLADAGRLVEAYAELGRVVIEAKEMQRSDTRYAKAEEAARHEREQLAPKLGFINISIENPQEETVLTVGSETLRRAAWTEPVPVMPGQTDVVLQTPGREPVRQTVALQPGEQIAVRLDAMGSSPSNVPGPVEADTGQTDLRPYAYVAGGIGAAGILTFIIAGSMSQSTYNDLDQTCSGGPCPADKASDIDAGRTQQTIANIGLGVGIAGLATGVTLFLLSSPKQEKAQPATSLVVSPTWIGIQGSL